MDAFAAEAYERMCTACEDSDLSRVMAVMATEERLHERWWQQLIEAWDQGLVPDIVNDAENLAWEMRGLLSDLHASVPADFGGMSEGEILEVAAKLEFYLLDPVFAELLDLTEPGSAKKHRVEHEKHIQHLIDAIERHFGTGSLMGFLARVLKRTWNDNLALARSATRDPLTGLYNRRGLMVHLRHWIAWAARYKRPLAVILVDVDDFKRINDERGHAAGDSVLVAAAKVLMNSTRASDMVARYGGDEFAVLAPETDAATCAQIAARIVETSRAITAEDWDGSDVRIMVSVGSAVLEPEGSIGPRTPDELLAAADRSLHSAKQAGKNRAGATSLVGLSEPSAEQGDAG